MKNTTAKNSVGVIVARFQVYKLAEAHKELIRSVLAKHNRVLIYLGLSPLKGSSANPLTFQARKAAIQEAFPEEAKNIHIGYINDSHSDIIWSEKLDKNIADYTNQNDDVIVYGGRERFYNRYIGIHKKMELTPLRQISNAEMTHELAKEPQTNPAFRAGVCWAASERYPTAFSAVDIALIDAQGRLCVVRKPAESKWRLPGGFVDPIKDESIEDAARRELKEETDLTVHGELSYIYSCKQKDWRYYDSKDKIFTHLYVGKKKEHEIGVANDDVAELNWIDLNNLNDTNIVPEHLDLINVVKKNVL